MSKFKKIFLSLIGLLFTVSLIIGLYKLPEVDIQRFLTGILSIYGLCLIVVQVDLFN